MTWTIPSETPYTIRKGNRGIVVWAVQRALNDTFKGTPLTLDGVYGKQVTTRCKGFQRTEGLGDDGQFGPASSKAMALTLQSKVNSVELPTGLLQGIVEGESGNLIGAVNWSVPGGVDCGYCQRRVYTQDQSDAAIERAFNGLYQMTLLGNNLRTRHDYYLSRSAGTSRFCWRLATLYHNYPSGADKIAEVGIDGLSPYWTTEQSWVIAIGGHNSETGEPISVYFPDGKRVETPLEWCQRYALGDPGHDEPGQMVRFVSDWTP